MAIPKESMSQLDAVRHIEFPTFVEPARGTLSVAEVGKEIPFPIVRAFHIYGVPAGADRGAHAHRRTEQVFVAVSGRFEVELRDPRYTRKYTMQDPARGLYVPARIWARLYDFSKVAVCLVLTSGPYDPADYLPDWKSFLAAGHDQRS